MNVDGTEVLIEGAGAEAIVLIHGWPDTARLWDAQVEALAPRYRCVRFNLPGFDDSTPERAFAVDEVVERIHRVVERACPGERVTLLLHDWGCIFGYRFATQHPECVARIVAVDVGDAGSRRHVADLKLLGRAAIPAYQLWLAVAWRIGGPVGTGMARAFAWIIRAPTDLRRVDARMCYPYAVVWFGVEGGFPTRRSLAPAVPMLFVYGERKPFMLHSRAWAEAIASRPGSGVVALPSGHWVMVGQRAAFEAAVLAWLAEGSDAAAGDSTPAARDAR